MNEFVVRLADERGRVLEQTHMAANAEELHARFTQAGYYVYSVKSRGSLAGSRKKVKLETFLIFNQQFLTLIRAGLPILGSLDLLARRQKIPQFRGQLEDVAARVKTGESISQAFEAQGGFPLVYTTTLLAGERSGNLEEVLQRYLDFQRVSLTFRKKLKASLIYPALLIIMVIGLFIFLITFVVPRFAQLYEQLGTALPSLTVFLMDLGRNAQNYGIYFAIVVAALGYLLYRWTKTDAGAMLIDRVRIGIPVFGDVWLKYQVGLFARTLSTLLTGGLPLVPSLETAARSIDSRQVASAILRSVGTVREGKGLSRSLEQTKAFPELAIEMIEVGESTGALPQMLNPVAGLVSLTLLLAIYLFFEGIFEVVAFFQVRSREGSGWLLFDGLITLLLAIMIWRQWPFSTVWAIGTLVGISMLFSGFSRLMLSLGAKRVLKAF